MAHCGGNQFMRLSVHPLQYLQLNRYESQQSTVIFRRQPGRQGAVVVISSLDCLCTIQPVINHKIWTSFVIYILKQWLHLYILYITLIKFCCKFQSLLSGESVGTKFLPSSPQPLRSDKCYTSLAESTKVWTFRIIIRKAACMIFFW